MKITLHFIGTLNILIIIYKYIFYIDHFTLKIYFAQLNLLKMYMKWMQKQQNKFQI